MEKHIGKLVIDAFKIRRLTKYYYDNIDGWYVYEITDAPYGSSMCSSITEPNIIPLYGVIPMEDYQELERWWDINYHPYDDESENENEE